MNSRFKLIILLALLLVMWHPSYSQSFEGTITLHVTSDHKESSTMLTIRGDKTLLEADIDSTESIKIIKDWEAETTTLLRRKNDLKYGFRTLGIPESDPPVHDEKVSGNIKTDITDEVKMIDSYKCTKVIYKSPFAISEAWITKDAGFSLSKYFPEFLGSSTDPHLYDLRKAANKEGFVMRYWEKLIDSGKESNLDMIVTPKEIPNEVFNISAEYLVLDQESMKRLLQDSQRDEVKKKQWDEFMQLFGNK
ncbi:MAG: DUF4412 domain-containing protein [Saprospiraceae bacterium]